MTEKSEPEPKPEIDKYPKIIVVGIYYVNKYMDDLGIKKLNKNELSELSFFVGSLFWVWMLGWLGFSFFWSIFVGFLVFWFRFSKLQYSSRHKILEKLSDGLSVDDHGERDYDKKYKILEKFIQAGFAESIQPKFKLVPDYEKIEWLNTLLVELWPFIEKYVKDKILPQVTKDIPKYLFLKIDPFDLGKRPPRVERIKVYDPKDRVDRSYIDLDIKLTWIADLTVEASALGIPVGLRELELSSELRITLDPLLADLPLGLGLLQFYGDEPVLN